jgi:hypothetical protein
VNHYLEICNHEFGLTSRRTESPVKICRVNRSIAILGRAEAEAPMNIVAQATVQNRAVVRETLVV